MGKTYTDFSINAIMGLTRRLEESKLLGTFSAQCKIERELVRQSYHNHQETTATAQSVITPTRIQVQYNDQQFIHHNVGVVSTDGITNISICHNNNDEDSNKNIKKKTVKRVRAKKYKCELCWVALSNSGQYRGHLRTHTGERPFHCDHPNCGKQFTRNEELTRHKRIHTGVKPFACELCKKRFGRRDHLKKHLKTHNRRQEQEQQNNANNANIVDHEDDCQDNRNDDTQDLSSYDLRQQLDIMTNSPCDLSLSSSISSTSSLSCTSSSVSSRPASTLLSPNSYPECPTDLSKPKTFINQQTTTQRQRATA